MFFQRSLKSVVCLFVGAILAGSSAFAADSSLANINQGNVKVGGSLALDHEMINGGSTTTLTLNPSAQYFIVDHLAVGAAFELDHTFSGGDGSTFVSFGPAASYYCPIQSKFVPYVQEQFLYKHDNQLDGIHWFDLQSSIGVDYFFTPSVALGPAVRWIHTFGNTDENGVVVNTANDIGLVAQFSIYL